MASRHDSNGPLSPWTDDRSRCVTISPVPVQPTNHGPMPKKTTTIPGALVSARAGCRWLTEDYARLMSSVRLSRKAADSTGRPVVPQFATLVFRGLDPWTILGVQLPACLRRA